eukprot:6215912-Prorocentrum_lima.AAC.1
MRDDEAQPCHFLLRGTMASEAPSFDTCPWLYHSASMVSPSLPSHPPLHLSLIHISEPTRLDVI